MTQKKDKATAEQADTAKQTDTAEQAGTAKQTDTFVVELGLSVEDQVNWQKFLTYNATAITAL